MNINIDKCIQQVTFIPTVVAYLIDSEGHVTLGLRKTELGNGFLSGIGGKIGDSEDTVNETADEALVRELQEELGIVPIKFQPYGLVRFLYPHKPTKNMQTIPYLITSWEGEPRESDSIIPMRFNLKKVPFDRMWKDNKIWLPRVLEKETIFCDILYNSDNQVQKYSFRNA